MPTLGRGKQGIKMDNYDDYYYYYYYDDEDDDDDKVRTSH